MADSGSRRLGAWAGPIAVCALATGVGVALGRLGLAAAPAPVVAGVGISSWVVLTGILGAYLGLVHGPRRAIALLLLATFPAAGLGLAAGVGQAALTASLPVVGAGLPAYGVARCLLRLRVDPVSAVLAASVPVALLASLPLLADPWIEWDGSSPRAPDRAATVIRLDPMSAVGSAVDGTGWDRQRGRVLYSGPSGDGAGLSVIGQYYPARPSAAWQWAGIAAVLGLIATGLGRSPGSRGSRPTDSGASTTADATMSS